MRNVVADKDDAVIVRSTIELGHNMGLKVVAEGVEDHAALMLLTNLGCDEAQGYFIAKPLPPKNTKPAAPPPVGGRQTHRERLHQRQNR